MQVLESEIDAIIPSNRLECLLDHALKYQLENCEFHNQTPDEKLSLLVEHKCPKSELPQSCSLAINKNKDQVWHVYFAPSNQRRFCTVAKDGTLQFYSICEEQNEVKFDLQILTYLECASLAWSNASDSFVCVGARDKQAYIFDTRTGEVHYKTEKSHTGDIQQCFFARDDT